MKQYKLIGSASSLQALSELVIKRWTWSHCIFKDTELKNVWTVQSSPDFTGFIEGLRVVKSKGRYRLETEV